MPTIKLKTKKNHFHRILSRSMTTYFWHLRPGCLLLHHSPSPSRTAGSWPPTSSPWLPANYFPCSHVMSRCIHKPPAPVLGAWQRICTDSQERKALIKKILPGSRKLFSAWWSVLFKSFMAVYLNWKWMEVDEVKGLDIARKARLLRNVNILIKEIWWAFIKWGGWSFYLLID